MPPFALGAHRSPLDTRDYAVSAFLPATPPPLPAFLDLRPYLQPVRNQLDEGTCAPHAVASGAMGKAEKDGPGRLLSVRWLYELARKQMPVPGGAEGAYLRAIMAVLYQTGCCLEADQPYTPHVVPPPGPLAAEHAAENRAGSYAAVALDVTAIKQALVHFGPVVVAADVDDGFMSPSPKGAIIIPSGAQHGGHAFCLVGWNDRLQCWLIRNSWGTEWGDGGYAWLPWSWPLWEAWSLTPALLPDGSHPPPPSLPWWDAMFPWLRGLGL